MELTWLEVLALFESRVEDLCTSSRRYMPSTLQLNRTLRDWMLCEIEGKCYWNERRKLLSKKKDELTDEEIINWMKMH